LDKEAYRAMICTEASSREDGGREGGALLEKTIRYQPAIKPRTRDSRRMPMGEVVTIRVAVPPYILKVGSSHDLPQSWSALEASPLTRLGDVRRDDHILRMEDAVEVPCQHDGPAVSW
jgi:hypothetical protein